MINIIMTTNERILIGIDKDDLKEEIILKFYADVSFLFVSFQYYADLFLFFMKLVEKNMKETKFLQENLLGYLFLKFLFLDNRIHHGVITSNHT